MKGLVCLVGLLLAGLCSASPAGREFATSFMQNFDGRDTRSLIEVAALSSSRGSTAVKVSAVGSVYEKEISPGKSVSFVLPDSVELRGGKKSRQTVRIEASQDVTVMSLNFKRRTADTSVVYPVEDWGTEYIIFTPSGTQKDTFKEFSITNHKEDNSVEIFLRGSVRFQGKYYRRGSKMTLKLEAFETVQIQSLDDLSGTFVVSRLPVAVSSGHSCVQKYTSCSHVYEQLLPVNSWGKEFVIAPLPYRNVFSSSHDSVFVQASQRTEITVNVNGKVQSHPMFAGQTLELSSQWPHAVYLTSDNGIQVLFEFNGRPDDEVKYIDPFLMTILPTSHFSTSYSLEGQGDFYNNIIIVARNKDLDGIKIDPKPQSANFNWRKVDGTDFSWAEMYYSTGANLYQISHPDSPFGVYSYGVAYANGYGSLAVADPAAIRCSENSHYQICSETCGSPCPGLTDIIQCPTTCAEGCACNEGYYFNGTDCVVLEDCSCYYEGRAYKIGESVLSDDCQQRCNCTASGEVECQDFSCRATESCQLNNGILGCRPTQCRMETGGSIALFSGATGTISVLGAYEIIAHCDESAADWFRVVAKLQECTLTGVRGVVAVYVYFNDLSVTVTDKQETWVNGKKVTPPSLPGNNIFLTRSEKTIILEQASHFQLSYSNTQELVVTVSDSMAGKLCGACGRFLPFRDTTDVSQEMMQEYIASFSAQDFPTCEL